jgi:hypothetical protein
VAEFRTHAPYQQVAVLPPIDYDALQRAPSPLPLRTDGLAYLPGQF